MNIDNYYMHIILKTIVIYFYFLKDVLFIFLDVSYDHEHHFNLSTCLLHMFAPQEI